MVNGVAGCTAPTVPAVCRQHLSPMSRPPKGSARRLTLENPLLDAFNQTTATAADAGDTRDELIARYGFAVPTDQALDAIRRCSPDGVIEVGAGTGYWAHMLHQRGIDVVAFDIEPAPSPQNTWFAGTRPWHPVQHGDHEMAGRHPERTLLIVWPTKNEVWAAEAVTRYHDAGGAHLVYVGEGPGGRTGDDVFDALLGELTACAQCRYGSTTSPCICSVDARWHRTETVALPHWSGYDDDLHIYTRQARNRPSPRQLRRLKQRRPRTRQREP